MSFLPADWQFASYDLTARRGALTFLIAAILVGFFVHLAAKMVLKKDNVYMGLAAGVYGMLLAIFARTLVNDELVGFIVGLLAFCAAVWAIYRVKFSQAIGIGALSWLLWMVAMYALGYVQGHWH